MPRRCRLLRPMAFALRHLVLLVIVALAVVATGAVFAFARPQYHAQYESKMLDFSKLHYYNPASVRHAFAANHVDLRSAAHAGDLVFSDHAKPWPADALQVAVGPRKGRGSFGPKLEPYDERFGNVMVTYGGHNEQLLRRIENAVAAIRQSG
jgi:hypothetical protein